IKQIPGTISKTGATLEVFGTEAARLTGIILQDFCLDFDKDNMTMAISPRDVEVLNLKYCTDYVVSNVKTLNGIGEGIDLDDCLDGLVFKSHSENNNGWGIHVSGGSKRNKIIGNTVLNNGHVEFRGGIDQYDGTETVEPAADNIYIGNYAE